MTITPALLRQNFPEFSDTAKYPDAQIQYWLTLSVSFLSRCVWLDDNIFDFGTQLFAMHYLSLFQKNLLTASAGGVPGGSVQGPVTSKTVDKVSVAYNATLVALENGGQWNMTTYGIQFLQIARMVGMGGIQMMPAASLVNLNNNFNPYVSN